MSQVIGKFEVPPEFAGRLIIVKSTGEIVALDKGGGKALSAAFKARRERLEKKLAELRKAARKTLSVEDVKRVEEAQAELKELNENREFEE